MMAVQLAIVLPKMKTNTKTHDIKGNKDFEKLRALIESRDEIRDKIINKSREVIRLSKKLIYAIHRSEDQEPHRKSLETAYSELVSLEKKNRNCTGSYNIAVQEYVEAVAYHYFHKHKKLIPFSELEIDPEEYLLGISDLVGELVRRAVNSVIREEYDEFHKIKELVIEIYEQMVLFDFRQNDLRKKVDSMKYEVKKLEEISLQLKLK